jgi:hypothetical protein
MRRDEDWLAAGFLIPGTAVTAQRTESLRFMVFADRRAWKEPESIGSVRSLPGGHDHTAADMNRAVALLVVEANRVPPPTAPLAVVVATNQVFACRSPTGRDVVARAGSPFPFAVSPEGTKLAVSDGKSIYLKNIPP